MQSTRLAESFELLTGSVPLTRLEKFPCKATCDPAVFLQTAWIYPGAKVLFCCFYAVTCEPSNQGCGARAQISSSRDLKFLTPAPQWFGPMTTKNYLFVWTTCLPSIFSVEFEPKFQALAPAIQNCIGSSATALSETLESQSKDQKTRILA